MLTAQDLIQMKKIQTAEDGKEEEEVAVEPCDDSDKGKLKRRPSLPLPPEEKDPNVKTIKDLLTDARLDSYLEIAKQQKVYLFDLWTADEKKVETLIEKMKMKPGHVVRIRFSDEKYVASDVFGVLRLKRSLENAKEAIEKWIVLPHVTPQMNPAQRSLSFYSDNKVSFEDFKTLIKTDDIEALEKFVDRYDNNEKVLRHFLKERFKAQTKQSLRDLRSRLVIQKAPHSLFFLQIVVCYKKPRVVAQKLVPAFKNVDEFKRFAQKNEANLRFVADNELSSACSLQKMIRVLESKEHEKNMREAFKHFNDMYETRRSE
eukprot:jgi/Bigna1/141567/aug1.63_g16275